MSPVMEIGLPQTARGTAPHPLQLFVRLLEPSEFQFRAAGLKMVEFGNLYADLIRPLQALIYRMPITLLNPNYWEPLTKESENAVRDKMTGIITRNEGGRTLLWRSDHVSRTRLLRDGIDAPVELLSGYVFRTTGEGLLALGRAWDGGDRFEWAGLAHPPADGVTTETLSRIHADLAQLRMSAPGVTVLFSSQDDAEARAVFTSRDLLRRGIEALLRHFIQTNTHAHVGRINAQVCDQLARIADDVGLCAEPGRDLIDMGRTVEIHARLGRDPHGDGNRIIIYYDRISGIWAVSH